MAKKKLTDISDLPEKFPRKQSEGPKMDYSNLAFPKPKGKRKKNGREQQSK